jgi:hypothetical protein
MFVICHTYIDVIRIRIYKFIICLYYGFLKVITLGKPLTRAKAYIDTHKKKGGGYPNDGSMRGLYGSYTLS